MKLEMKPVIVGHPYPVLDGHGYRCFDGERWHDCDSQGNIIRRWG